MNNDKIIDVIISKKKALEARKEQKARAEGKLESQMQQLKEKFNCLSIKEAEERLNEIEEEIEKKSCKLQTGLEKWKEKYDGEDL